MQNHTKSCLYDEVRDDSNSFCKVLVWYYEVGMTNIFTILLTIYQTLDTLDTVATRLLQENIYSHVPVENVTPQSN